MAKIKSQKYIVSGEKKYRLSAFDFKIRKSKKRIIKRGKSGNYNVSVNGILFEGKVIEKHQNKYKVMLNGNTYSFVIDTEASYNRKVSLASKNGKDQLMQIKAPMPGKICDVFVEEGMMIRKGEAILVLEAMKMQNQILASTNAKVEKVMIKPGETVFGEQLLIDMKLVE
jgi:biotin carboxyl carrier protein